MYYIALLNASWDTTVWVGLNNNEITWSSKIENSGYFNTMEEAKARVEQDCLDSLGAIGTYKIIAFTEEELKGFGVTL
ncbi:hypothetical protein P7J41_05540 [Streptococcus suis]|uniref:hypothetical protein n=1 Tax=Streptococcus suis TaxID=1307 RepID=UPI0038B6BDF8